MPIDTHYYPTLTFGPTLSEVSSLFLILWIGPMSDSFSPATLDILASGQTPKVFLIYVLLYQDTKTHAAACQYCTYQRLFGFNLRCLASYPSSRGRVLRKTIEFEIFLCCEMMDRFLAI